MKKRTPDRSWSPEAILRYWVSERHAIYTRRLVGKPWPWTCDPILQNFRFTNISRVYDKLTVLLRRDLDVISGDRKKVFAAILFRLFNRASTWELLRGHALRRWSLRHAARTLKAAYDRGDAITSGVWMVGSKRGEAAYLTQLKAADFAHGRAALIAGHRSLERVYTELLTIPNVGPFVANEILMDLTYNTKLLRAAPDRETWVTLGPGSVRGIRRITTPKTAYTGFTQLKATLADEQHFSNIVSSLQSRPPRGAPALSVHDVEHVLCEFDKYCRVLLEGARLKNSYRPPA